MSFHWANRHSATSPAALLSHSIPELPLKPSSVTASRFGPPATPARASFTPLKVAFPNSHSAPAIPHTIWLRLVKTILSRMIKLTHCSSIFGRAKSSWVITMGNNNVAQLVRDIVQSDDSEDLAATALRREFRFRLFMSRVALGL